MELDAYLTKSVQVVYAVPVVGCHGNAYLLQNQIRLPHQHQLHLSLITMKVAKITPKQ